MTDEAIKAIKFKWKSHMSLENEHITVYDSECGRFGICDHVPYKGMSPWGRSYTHYRIRDKTFKTKKKFIQALREFDETK